MNKNIFFNLIIFFIFLTSFITSHKLNKVILQDENKIPWINIRKLNWSDFKQNPPEDRDSFIGAMTQASIEIDSAYFKNNIPKYKIRSYFIKNKSWTVVTDAYSLNHEQLHFDIAELFARKIRKTFDSLNSRKNKDVQQYQKEYDLNGEKFSKYQNLYDEEVIFDSIMQKRWIKKIAVELNKLKRYEYIK